MENDTCLYHTVSLKEESVEHNSEALANVITPHGSFVPYNIFQTLPFSYNLCAVNFKEKCGMEAWKSVSHLSHIHPEGTLHVLLLLKIYRQLTEHNLSTKYSIWDCVLVPESHCSFHTCSFCSDLSCQLMAFLSLVQHHSSSFLSQPSCCVLSCLLECAVSFVFMYIKSVKKNMNASCKSQGLNVFNFSYSFFFISISALCSSTLRYNFLSLKKAYLFFFFKLTGGFLKMKKMD